MPLSEYLFAPMEGITLSEYRLLHHRIFGGVSEYYTPFIAPDSKGGFREKYLKELTTGSQEYCLIPQLLINSGEAFIATADKLHEIGFDEINLNVGCPSGTVFSKHKGAGMLQNREKLKDVLDCIYSHAEQKNYRISLKTRMGVHSTDEFPEILEIYNRYPVSKLIIHARCRDDFYQGPPDRSGVADAMQICQCPVTYNGDINDVEDIRKLMKIMPNLRSVMIGRGAVANPAVFRELRGGAQLQLAELRRFHDELTERWLQSGLSPIYTMQRMKTLWTYLQVNFPENQREIKAILKAKKLEEYKNATAVLLG